MKKVWNDYVVASKELFEVTLRVFEQVATVSVDYSDIFYDLSDTEAPTAKLYKFIVNYMGLCFYRLCADFFIRQGLEFPFDELPSAKDCGDYGDILNASYFLFRMIGDVTPSRKLLRKDVCTYDYDFIGQEDAQMFYGIAAAAYTLDTGQIRDVLKRWSNKIGNGGKLDFCLADVNEGEIELLKELYADELGRDGEGYCDDSAGSMEVLGVTDPGELEHKVKELQADDDIEYLWKRFLYLPVSELDDILHALTCPPSKYEVDYTCSATMLERLDLTPFLKNEAVPEEVRGVLVGLFIDTFQNVPMNTRWDSQHIRLVTHSSELLQIDHIFAAEDREMVSELAFDEEVDLSMTAAMMVFTGAVMLAEKLGKEDSHGLECV